MRIIAVTVPDGTTFRSLITAVEEQTTARVANYVPNDPLVVHGYGVLDNCCLTITLYDPEDTPEGFSAWDGDADDILAVLRSLGCV